MYSKTETVNEWEMVCRCGIIFNSTKVPIRSVVTEWPVFITDSDILRSRSYTVPSLHSREACYELRVGQPIVDLHFCRRPNNHIHGRQPSEL